MVNYIKLKSRPTSIMTYDPFASNCKYVPTLILATPNDVVGTNIVAG